MHDADTWADVSIHAPARGATSQSSNLFSFAHCFNPRSREGSDRHIRHIIPISNRFQSTLPRGERPILAIGISTRLSFQSTLPRGERQPKSDPSPSNVPFQSTLPRGERPSLKYYTDYGRRFNPRSREGSDARFFSSLYSIIGFQSTLPRGERPGPLSQGY